MFDQDSMRDTLIRAGITMANTMLAQMRANINRLAQEGRIRPPIVVSAEDYRQQTHPNIVEGSITPVIVDPARLLDEKKS